MPKLNIRIGKKPSAAVVAVRGRVDEFDAAATGFADATKTSMDTFAQYLKAVSLLFLYLPCCFPSE